MMDEAQEQEDTALQRKSVGAALGIGILLLPFVFAWFTLRKGYGKVARAVSLGWMALVLLIGVGAQADRQDEATVASDHSAPEVAATQQGPSAEQPAGDTYTPAANSSALIERAKQFHGCGIAAGTLAAVSRHSDRDKSNRLMQASIIDLNIAVEFAVLSGIDKNDAKVFLKSQHYFEEDLLKDLSSDHPNNPDEDMSKSDESSAICASMIKNAESDADLLYIIQNKDVESGTEDFK